MKQFEICITPLEFTIIFFPLKYLWSHEDINVYVCYASVDIFILDILYISFRTNIFSPIIFFAARVTIRATCLHFVGAPLPRSPVFCHPGSTDLFSASCSFPRFSWFWFSGSRFFSVQVFQGPRFLGFRFFRVRAWVQVLEVAIIFSYICAGFRF